MQTISGNLAQLQSMFSGIDDELDRYSLLIELSSLLPGSDGLRDEQNLYRGCQSQVWLRAEAPDGLCRLVGDSDTVLIRGVQLLGSPSRCSGAVSFTVPGVHPFDIGALLDAQGVAVRTGHLCAMPLLTRFGLDSVVRVSPAFYNTQQELRSFCAALEKALALLQK